jgi:hypothetical protein
VHCIDVVRRLRAVVCHQLAATNKVQAFAGESIIINWHVLEVHIMKASVTITFATLLSVLSVGLAQAQDVKTGGNYDRPGRAIDEEAVKWRGASDKPGRAIDDNTVRNGANYDKPGRALDEDTVKSRGASDKPGRALEEADVKTEGRTDKPGREVNADPSKYQ